MTGTLSLRSNIPPTMDQSVMDDLLLCSHTYPMRELECWSPVSVKSARRFDGVAIREDLLGITRILVSTRARHVVVAVVGRYTRETSALVLLGALPRATHRTLILQDRISGEVSCRPFSRWQILFAWTPWLILRWLVDTVVGWAIIIYSYLWLTPQLLILRRRNVRKEDRGRPS